MGNFLKYLSIGVFAVIPFLIVFQVVVFVQDFGANFIFESADKLGGLSYFIVVCVMVVALLGAIGYSIENYGKSLVISLSERIIEKLPAIRTVYSISKKLTDIFNPSKNDEKTEIVILEFLHKNVWSIAYVLNKFDNKLVLFVPTSPNPTSGYTVIVEREYVQTTTLSLEEASKFIISMGADFVKKEELCDIISAFKK